MTARFAHAKTVWLFDLDNTLHDASHAVFERIDHSMTRAVMTYLNVDEPTAHDYRKKYWERYGATVIGMQRHHGINPHHFLQASHDFDIEQSVRFEPHLRTFLKSLPGTKLIYTNAPKHYTETVLKTLRIFDLFEGIFAIDDMKIGKIHYPKPSLAMLKRILCKIGRHRPDRIIFVEDTLKNLKPAKQLGLTTVHLFHPNTPFSTTKPIKPSYVTKRIKHLYQLRSI